MENLERQSLPVAAIYVFDGGDVAPEWLHGHKICASSPLTMYEAWNLALAATRTPLVANLNLDDRFATDALARMTTALQGDPQASLVGGDWVVCHTQEETDAVGATRELTGIPMFSFWPPPATERGSRLGIGDGRNLGTMGPGCLWRMDVHMKFPRYPYRFGDGTPIRVIGDFIWCKLLADSGRRLLRVPLIVGHYRTWPEVQAEFRFSKEAEHAQTQISLL